MSENFDANLVGQCGINCGTCVAFFGYTMAGKQRLHTCLGCRTRQSLCAFIKQGCKRISEKKPVAFCFECSDFACENLVKIDTVYRTKYKMSLIENLNYIKEKGMNAFLESEKEKYTCPTCGEVVCVHTKRCYACNPP
ncbi:MAG: DUF3795 domain-containing protein [archaeon]|nr:DUF3795 domain-containing protein [Candidatus Bathyarchaeum sp.]